MGTPAGLLRPPNPRPSYPAKAGYPVIPIFSLIAGVTAYWVARSSRATTGLSMLRHPAPFSDHGFAHLPGLLRAGHLIDLHRDLLADEALQLCLLGIIAGDDLKSFRPGFQTAKPVRRRQPVRFADELKGVDALALGAAAHGVELSGQNIAVPDRLLRLRVERAHSNDRQNSRGQRGSFTEVTSCHLSSDSSFKTAFAAAWPRTACLHRDNRVRRRPARRGRAASP